MVEIAAKLWGALLFCSPLLLATVIWLSRSTKGTSRQAKTLFKTSLIIASCVGLYGIIEALSGGLLFLLSPFFFLKWMFIGFSIIWPILVFIKLSNQKDTIRVAGIIIFLGISSLITSILTIPYVEYKDQEDRQYWDNFFENNEINRPRSELKKRLTKEGQHALAQHLRTGYTTTVESLAIITEMCREILDDLMKNKRLDNRSYILKITCEQGLSDITINRTINREFIEKYLVKKDENGVLVFDTSLALNASTPFDILVRLSQLPEPPIYNLVMNANTPQEVFEIIACDDNDYESVLLRMKNLDKKKGLSAMNVDYLRNIRMHLNMMDKSEKERIQRDAKRTLEGLQGRDRAAEIIYQAIQAVKRNEVSSVAEILSEIKERDLSMRDREQVYYGMLLCITGNYERAKSAYWNAEHRMSSYGQYNKDRLSQYITTRLLSGGGADGLLTKMSEWYPNDVKIQEFVKNYPRLKQELEKFAVDDYHKPAAAPESMDTFLSFGIFD